MIKSMTGFASLTRDDERAAIGVTIRAVNHRFLDLQLRLPQPIADVEPKLRALVQKRLARGRVEVSVSLQLRQAAAPEVALNEEFAAALAAAIERARSQDIVAGPLHVHRSTHIDRRASLVPHRRHGQQERAGLEGTALASRGGRVEL